ncbi:hypothetical protein RCO48_26025 [Peribacillus frigoritolerans]|nr:hypothetical protein [Peribacillus frigoritolerans]
MAKLKPISVDSQEPIYKVLELFQRGCKHPVIIMKNGKKSGSLDETEILHAYFSEKMTKRENRRPIIFLLNMLSFLQIEERIFF